MPAAADRVLHRSHFLHWLFEIQSDGTPVTRSSRKRGRAPGRQVLGVRLVSNQLPRNGFQGRNPAGVDIECGRRADFRPCGTSWSSFHPPPAYLIEKRDPIRLIIIYKLIHPPMGTKVSPYSVPIHFLTQHGHGGRCMNFGRGKMFILLDFPAFSVCSMVQHPAFQCNRCPPIRTLHCGIREV